MWLRVGDSAGLSHGGGVSDSPIAKKAHSHESFKVFWKAENYWLRYPLTSAWAPMLFTKHTLFITERPNRENNAATKPPPHQQHAGPVRSTRVLINPQPRQLRAIRITCHWYRYTILHTHPIVVSTYFQGSTSLTIVRTCTGEQKGWRLPIRVETPVRTSCTPAHHYTSSSCRGVRLAWVLIRKPLRDMEICAQ